MKWLGHGIPWAPWGPMRQSGTQGPGPLSTGPGPWTHIGACWGGLPHQLWSPKGLIWSLLGTIPVQKGPKGLVWSLLGAKSIPKGTYGVPWGPWDPMGPWDHRSYGHHGAALPLQMLIYRF